MKSVTLIYQLRASPAGSTHSGASARSVEATVCASVSMDFAYLSVVRCPFLVDDVKDRNGTFLTCSYTDLHTR